MKRPKLDRRFGLLVGFGLVVCLLAVGFRTYYRKPIHGTWIGYSYLDSGDGTLYADRGFGQYAIVLNKDGTYEENGNSTSGLWSLSDETVTLKPVRFYNLLPEEHREKFRKRGKVSVTVEKLLAERMKPMQIRYRRDKDRLVFREHSMHYEFERQ